LTTTCFYPTGQNIFVKFCVIPEKYKKEIESKCFKFIWNRKSDKVKRTTLIGDFEKGG
jgi:hypothetical protein